MPSFNKYAFTSRVWAGQNQPAYLCQSITLEAASVRKMTAPGTHCKVNHLEQRGGSQKARWGSGLSGERTSVLCLWGHTETKARPDSSGRHGGGDPSRAALLPASRPFPRPLPLWRQATKETGSAVRWAVLSSVATLTGTLSGPGLPGGSPLVAEWELARRGRGCGVAPESYRFQALPVRQPAVPPSASTVLPPHPGWPSFIPLQPGRSRRRV